MVPAVGVIGVKEGWDHSEAVGGRAAADLDKGAGAGGKPDAHALHARWRPRRWSRRQRRIGGRLDQGRGRSILGWAHPELSPARPGEAGNQAAAGDVVEEEVERCAFLAILVDHPIEHAAKVPTASRTDDLLDAGVDGLDDDVFDRAHGADAHTARRGGDHKGGSVDGGHEVARVAIDAQLGAESARPGHVHRRCAPHRTRPPQGCVACWAADRLLGIGLAHAIIDGAGAFEVHRSSPAWVGVSNLVTTLTLRTWPLHWVSRILLPTRAEGSVRGVSVVGCR